MSELTLKQEQKTMFKCPVCNKPIFQEIGRNFGHPELPQKYYCKFCNWWSMLNNKTVSDLNEKGII